LINSHKNIFITGGAGVGKSYILNQLKLRYKDDIVLTAFSGVAAVNIGGMTIHSFAGIGKADIPVDIIATNICENKDKKIIKNTIIKTKMLAIDEISMCSKYLLEYLDYVFKKVRQCDKPFGGIQTIAVGDFFQLPPVPTKELKDSDDY
jgi:ATP-dependent DNA helicase PIF1